MSTVSFYNFIANCEAYSCALIFVSCMQTLKYDKYSLRVLGIYSNAVVLNRKDTFVLLLARSLSDLDY